MDRAKAPQRLKKCLALSKSPEPHEAAAALRQAQKLMEAFDLDQDDVQRLEYANEAVSCPIQINQKTPLHLQSLVWLINHAFGVTAVIEHELRESDLSYRIRYFGPVSRIQLAAYTHTVVYRAMNNCWTKYLKENPRLRGVRGARSGFFLGFIDATNAQVIIFAMTDEGKARTDVVKAEHYGERGLVKTKTSNTSTLVSTGMAGLASGSAFALHRPMQADKLKITR